MSNVYIYALSTEVFPDQQAYFDMSPKTEYFYVGRTERSLERRKSEHAGEARRGSSYPYHEKIRKLGEGWDLEELGRVDKDSVSDHEEYYMIKLTCDGHPLLNVKRGDKVRRDSESLLNGLCQNNINNSHEYAEAMKGVRREKIKLREFRQIASKIKHLRYDDQTETHYYDLEGDIHTTDKYTSKKELINHLCPSVNQELLDLMNKVKKFIKESRTN